MQIFTPYFLHALHILQILERSHELVSTQKLKEEAIPRSYAVKIFARLTKLGCVVAKEGRKGGYRLVGDSRSALIKLFGEQSWAQAQTMLN